MSNRIRTLLAVGATAIALVGTSSPAGALPAYTKDPSSFTNPNLTGQPKIVNLRVSEHKNFDRIVIDVKGRRPSYKISYVDQLTYDASGLPVPLAGRKKLAIVLDPARAHNDSGDNVYVGPKLKQYQLPMLRGVAFTGDFEGVVSFGFTARRKNGYRVFTLINPSRVVIDLKHQ
jgi:hypothetical protein